MALLRFFVLTIAVFWSPVAVGGAGGYKVKTVFDGNTLGVSFDSLHEDVDGSVIALDSTKSSLLRVSLPLSQSSVVERVVGGSGYRDGPMNEALFNHPRKIAIDTDGNIYVADPKNGAVRMLTKTGFVATIAGGSNRTGHSDGEGGEVTFSTDFEVTYLHSTCTLAVADRGNRMVREIQLPHFVGRCNSGTTFPDSLYSTGATILLFLLAGIAGAAVGALLTIHTISTPQLEQWQSTLARTGDGDGPQLGQLIDLEDDNGDTTQGSPAAAPAGGEGNLLHHSLLQQPQVK